MCVYVCVLLNAPVNEDPMLQRNHDGTLRVVQVPADLTWLLSKVLIKLQRELIAEPAGTQVLCYGVQRWYSTQWKVRKIHLVPL